MRMPDGHFFRNLAFATITQLVLTSANELWEDYIELHIPIGALNSLAKTLFLTAIGTIVERLRDRMNA